MLKGHVAIELTNVNTKKKKIYEADNMVTKALEEFFKCISVLNSSSAYIRMNYIAPMATKLLGGLYVFRDNLVESANNIKFPIDNPLVAFCSDDADITNPNRGSYNSIESGATSTGYKHVWDFATSQANGTIKALSLTHRDAGRVLTQPFVLSGTSPLPINFKKNDSVPASILYKDSYLYYVKKGASNNIVKVCKKYEPMTSLKLNDDPYVNGDEIEVATLTGTSGYNYGHNSYINHATTDGKDFAYIPANSSTNCKVMKINLSNFTMSEISLTLPWSPSAIRITKDGYLFAYNDTSYKVYIVNVNNTSDNREITLSGAAGYSSWITTSSGICAIPIGTTNGYYIIYKDGTVITQDEISNAVGNSIACHNIKDDTLLIRRDNAFATSDDAYSVQLQYLATIFNLETAITKTAADTMKIIYTLTDA